MGSTIHFKDKDSSGFLYLPNDKAEQEFKKLVKEAASQIVEDKL